MKKYILLFALVAALIAVPVYAQPCGSDTCIQNGDSGDPYGTGGGHCYYACTFTDGMWAHCAYGSPYPPGQSHSGSTSCTEHNALLEGPGFCEFSGVYCTAYLIKNEVQERYNWDQRATNIITFIRRRKLLTFTELAELIETAAAAERASGSPEAAYKVYRAEMECLGYPLTSPDGFPVEAGTPMRKPDPSSKT